MTTTVTVPLEDGTAYHGLYQIEIKRLPLEAAGKLLALIVFGAGLAFLFLSNGPEWAVWAATYFTTRSLLGLIGTSYRLLVQSREVRAAQ